MRLGWSARLKGALGGRASAASQAGVGIRLETPLVAASLRESLLTTVRGEANDAGNAPARPPARRSWRWHLQGARSLRPAVGFAVLLLLAAGVATGYLLRSTDDPEPSFIEAQTPSGHRHDVVSSPAAASASCRVAIQTENRTGRCRRRLGDARASGWLGHVARPRGAETRP
jgi:hypothetical protein